MSTGHGQEGALMRTTQGADVTCLAGSALVFERYIDAICQQLTVITSCHRKIDFDRKP